jgi:glycosyltransferase involved in cell wall biosynthesis
MDPRAVLHVVPPEPFGGAQSLAIDLAQVQNQTGLTAGIWYTNAGSVAQEMAATAGVEVVSPADGGGSLWQRLRALRSALRSRAFDIVHLHLPPPWLALVLPRRAAFGLVTHLHLPPPVHAGSPRCFIEALLARAVHSRSDHLISVSQWIENQWRSAYRNLAAPSQVVYNGINIPSHVTFRDQNSSATTIGMATRLIPDKGVEKFLDLATRILEMAPQVRFRVAGDGPMRCAYEAQAMQRGLGSDLSFCGFVKDMAAFWRDVDIAAITSPSESFGLGLIEPIAHGIPVIAYRNGTGSDEVIDRCRGIVASGYGQANELATVAVALAQSPQQRRQVAEAGRADLQLCFSLQTMEAGVRAAYRQVSGAAVCDRVDVPA